MAALIGQVRCFSRGSMCPRDQLFIRPHTITYAAPSPSPYRRVNHNHDSNSDRRDNYDRYGDQNDAQHYESRIIGYECWQIVERYEWRDDGYGHHYTQPIGRDRRKVC